eukprot:2672794-Rhodomonas_salina.1
MRCRELRSGVGRTGGGGGARGGGRAAADAQRCSLFPTQLPPVSPATLVCSAPSFLLVSRKLASCEASRCAVRATPAAHCRASPPPAPHPRCFCLACPALPLPLPLPLSLSPSLPPRSLSLSLALSLSLSLALSRSCALRLCPDSRGARVWRRTEAGGGDARRAAHVLAALEAEVPSYALPTPCPVLAYETVQAVRH